MIIVDSTVTAILFEISVVFKGKKNETATSVLDVHALPFTPLGKLSERSQISLFNVSF